jgi:SAM-dependent methyltransferase
MRLPKTYFAQLHNARLLATRLRFADSSSYWERRYNAGGTSGDGSYGAQAEYKAKFLNNLVGELGITSIIEFGCGDGNQLSLANYPRYLGLDVSPSAIKICLARFGRQCKSFALYDPLLFSDRAEFFRADLALSLDVIYHLVEDSAYSSYMAHLFDAARRYVVIYATDEIGPLSAAHVRRRQFTKDVPTGWSLARMEPKPAPDYQDFYVYLRE